MAMAAQKKRGAAPNSLHRLRQKADALAMALPPLLIATQRAARSVIHGVHGRRRAGPGEEFWQYRAYAPGDSAALIDWRKSARGQRIFVRETEWMAANTLWLWVQGDAGMRLRSPLADVSKAHRAAVLALAIARMVTRAGERIAALGAPFRPDHTNLALDRLARWFDPDHPASQEPLPPRVEVPRFSTCILIGDFFADPDALEERIRHLAAAGATGHLLQVVDPAEETFPFKGRTRFESSDGSQHLLFGRAEDIRQDYIRRLAALRHRLDQFARRLGWSFTVHRTDQSPQVPLLALRARLEGLPPAAMALPPEPAEGETPASAQAEHDGIGRTGS